MAPYNDRVHRPSYASTPHGHIPQNTECHSIAASVPKEADRYADHLVLLQAQQCTTQCLCNFIHHLIHVDTSTGQSFCVADFLPYLSFPSEKKILCSAASILDMISFFTISDIQKSRYTTSRMIRGYSSF